MKVAFITESPYYGKYPSNFPNARTEIAWQIALNADHFHFGGINKISDYDHVFIIIPKGKVFLSAEGSQIINGTNPVSPLLKLDLPSYLRKSGNKKIHFIQEGPNWWPQNYTVEDQIYWYNTLLSFDSIFSHNDHDGKYYRGLFPGKTVNSIRSLMVEDAIRHVVPNPENKVMIGGNFSHFYGGFNSYFIAEEFSECEKYTMDSHAKREDEHIIDDLKHLPRLDWKGWIEELSTFKYGIHLMNTVAAGTFSLNCGYLGIPCIGNMKMDTQRILFPQLSVDVEDLETSRKLAKKLRYDENFYNECSNYARNAFRTEYSLDVWKSRMTKVLSNI